MIPARAARLLISTLVLTSAATGCGGSSTTTDSVAAQTRPVSPATKACAATFEDIIRRTEALPPDVAGYLPAWPELFMSRRANLVPTVIGKPGYLMAYGARQGAVCTLTFDIPGGSPPGATLQFAVGYPTFGGSNSPVLGPSAGPHLPNVTVGPDGELLDSSAQPLTPAVPPSNSSSPTLTSTTTLSPTPTSTATTPSPSPSSSPATMTGDCGGASRVRVFDHRGATCAEANRVATAVWQNDAMRRGMAAVVDGWHCHAWVHAATECSKGDAYIDVTAH